ncbi:MAG: nitroreductase family protein [Pseudomonadota bacterium]
MINNIDTSEFRSTEYDVDGIFPERWSPRAMNGESLNEATLNHLFEAARWAPSAFNAQPWRFVYATRDSQHWDSFFGLLVEANQSWCARAGALIVLLSRHLFEHNDSPMKTHALDSGAAWQNLALQGARMGLVVHGMQGFDYDAARTAVNAPEEFTVQMMMAVGHPGPVSALSESQQGREQPSPRKAVAEISFAGSF